ncbi:MAG: meiotic recombination [Vezdaea acicularis]|nr:MAG: meiotic recombination [Vezdaea acicularis]
MPATTIPSTIRILIATDSHVGFCELDPIRGSDSEVSFDEVMQLAKKEDVDMVLLAGDLFHDNKPSRKAMNAVMRSLRRNCLGEKPVELEMLGDATDVFSGAFNHVNYEDPDINVAIPVFSIHGNHDDPSGEGHLCALDILQTSGLINYYGRTPESDNIAIKPVLLQKGHTKLALYGMSNVRDERLFRTFRDGKVKFFRPSTQQKDWFNLMSVHQNHHAYTETGYLPENFLPEFMDLVVWGHEHECLIDPKLNPEMGFYVMQPGSSVATSLCPGEAVPKHVAILSVTGKEFKIDTRRLKTVRPFVMKEIILNDIPKMKALSKKHDNRSQVTQYLTDIVNDLIKEATEEWKEVQGPSGEDEEREVPLPLVRLRVEYSAPDGGKVANVNDVVQFYRKKATATRRTKDGGEMPAEGALAQVTLDNVRVERLVREFLMAQSLTILPQNSFGDAVSQFVDKDDKHAMEQFVNESLKNQMENLMNIDHSNEEKLAEAMDSYRSKLEELFAAGHLKLNKKRKLKPKPDNWDTDLDGEWGDEPGALFLPDEDEGISGGEEENTSLPSTTPAPPAPRGRGSANTTVKKKAPAKKAAPIKTSRVKKTTAPPPEDNDDNNHDVIMLDDEEEEEVSPIKPAQGGKKAHPPRAAPNKRAPPRAAAAVGAGHSKLNLSQPATSQTNGTAKNALELSEDEISDDDDAFEPAPILSTRASRRR